RFGLASSQFDDELMALGAKTSRSNYSPEDVRQEGVAEFMRLYLTDPDEMIKVAPKFTEMFESKIPQDVKKVLENARNQIQLYIDQPLVLKSISELSIGRKRKMEFPTLNDLYTHMVEELNPIRESLKPLGKKK